MYIQQFKALPARLVLELETLIGATALPYKYLLASLDPLALDSEITAAEQRSAFDRVSVFLRNVGAGKDCQGCTKRDLKAVAGMFSKKLAANIKAAEKRGDEMAIASLAEHRAEADLLLQSLNGSPDERGTEEKKLADIAEEAQEEEEFTVYKDKAEKPRKRSAYAAAEDKANEVAAPMEEATARKCSCPIKISDSAMAEDTEFTLADALGLKTEERKSGGLRKRHRQQAGEGKKLTSIVTQGKIGWSTGQGEKQGESIQVLMKQEEEQKELSYMLKAIEEQENLEKAIEMSKKEAELAVQQKLDVQQLSEGYYEVSHAEYSSRLAGTQRGTRVRARGGMAYRRKASNY